MAAGDRAPTWVSASNGRTFIVTPLGTGWFASPATLTACSDPTLMLKTTDAPN